MGPKTAAADALHAMKYRGVGESFREAMNRVAFALKDSDEHYHQFRDILLHQRFLPAGRIQSAMGASRDTTPYNCFVSRIIADSFVAGPGSIMEVAHEAAATMRMGGGIGYDFSTLRPRGSLISKLESHSTGPISFMSIFDAVCLATSSSGHRRGAQMGVLRIDHPDVEEFIRAKQNDTALRGFNISLAVTDEFMEALLAKQPFALRWNGTVVREIDPVSLWEKIMRSTWDWAEPGVIFIDQINRMNNLYYCETIAATNPCSEQPLPPNGVCLLGSFNLVQYLTKGPEQYSFDYDVFKRDIPPVVRAMDNVIDRAKYPLPAQKAEAITKRRMGLGITGLANAGEALGYPYGSPKFLKFTREVMSTLRDHAYLASSQLAVEKGSFPLYDPVKYLQGEFIKTLPDIVQHAIFHNGIRNSHLISIAPTGTISMCADNVSSGLEPVFAYQTKRTINTPDGPVETVISDYGYDVLGVSGVLSADVPAFSHVSVLVAAQSYVDSAVSKTINMDGRAMSWEEFQSIYTDVWKFGGKGCTTFNSAGLRGALLTDDNAACRIDPETGQKNCG